MASGDVVNVAWEAGLRLHAGDGLIGLGHRADGEVQLRRALDFYRSVGAPFFVRRAEAALAAEAQSESA